MGSLILLNDVHVALDDENFLVGNIDEPASQKGERQAIEIGAKIQPYLKGINHVAASDATRLMAILHHVRTKSSTRLASTGVVYYEALRERNFGVLNGSRQSLGSSLFTHTRICAEGGESIAQARTRSVRLCERLVTGKDVLAISHPHICQILTNALLSKLHTIWTAFWFKKGSLIHLKFKKRRSWEFVKAYNALEDKEYSLDEVYNEIAVSE